MRYVPRQLVLKDLFLLLDLIVAFREDEVRLFSDSLVKLLKNFIVSYCGDIRVFIEYCRLPFGLSYPLFVLEHLHQHLGHTEMRKSLRVNDESDLRHEIYKELI